MRAALVLGSVLLCAACSRTHSRRALATVAAPPARPLDGGTFADCDGPAPPLSAGGAGAGSTDAENGGAGTGDCTNLGQCDALTLAWSVAAGANPCSIDLMPPASLPDELTLVVVEPNLPCALEKVPHDLGNGAAWTITSDGSHVELLGSLCNSAKSGRFSKLTFQFGCENHIPSIPPSHVM